MITVVFDRFASRFLRAILILVILVSALLLAADAINTVNLSYFGLAIVGHYILIYKGAPALYKDAPAAAVWFVIFSILLYVLMPRTVAYSLAHRIFILVLFGIHVSAIGTLRGSTISAVSYVAVASLYVFTLLRSNTAASIFISVLLSLSILLTAWELRRSFSLPQPSELPGLVVRRARTVCRGFRSITWIDWVGVGAIAMSLLSIWEKIAGPQKAFVKALVIFYQEMIEAIPDAVLGALFEGFSLRYPPIATPIALVLAICLRAAKLHSQRHERARLWRVIMFRILGHPTDEMFSSRSVFWFVLIIDYVIVTSALSYYGINPIRYFAGNSSASVESILFVGVVGCAMGVIGAIWIKLADSPGTVGAIARAFGVLVRAPFYGIPLLILSPFVAWRILMLSLGIFGTILYLNWPIIVKS